MSTVMHFILVKYFFQPFSYSCFIVLLISIPLHFSAPLQKRYQWPGYHWGLCFALLYPHNCQFHFGSQKMKCCPVVPKIIVLRWRKTLMHRPTIHFTFIALLPSLVFTLFSAVSEISSTVYFHNPTPVNYQQKAITSANINDCRCFRKIRLTKTAMK